jgi:hypothetical protein
MESRSKVAGVVPAIGGISRSASMLAARELFRLGATFSGILERITDDSIAKLIARVTVSFVSGIPSRAGGVVGNRLGTSGTSQP